ncbi:HAD family hydrolase [Calothrix sp. NIES-4071]|nr:HAD family hydrolase [Calothrix sp. NIES-4071]BAZ60943.1 HAD family hydrolase [Calothrix sp. NIES-4105]
MVDIRCREKIFSNIQAVLFDKNGTLEDSESHLLLLAKRCARVIDAQIPGTGEPLLMAFGVNNNTLDPAGLIAVASRRDTEIAAAAYIAETGRSWHESVAIARSSLDEADRYINTGQAVSPLFPGSLEVLESLSQAGVKLGILSAASTKEVLQFVEAHELGKYIQLSMGVDTGVGKPDPRLFLQACEQLGVKSSATLMVGDSMGDMQMAKNADAAGCIGITWINKPDHVKGADVVINQLSEIKIIS